MKPFLNYLKGLSLAYILEFKLAGLPPMTNNLSRRHWTVQLRNSAKWKNLVVGRSLALGIPVKPLLKAKLTLIRHSGMCPDSDGLVSGFKHIIDGLVQVGVLENDKFENIGMPEYRWEKTSPRKGYISIKVEGVE